MNNQVGYLQPTKSDSNIPAKLDVAQRALAEATEDWQRLDIRDYARAVAAATAILERKDIQIQAANLVHDAERAIAKANPALSTAETLKRARANNPNNFKGSRTVGSQDTNSSNSKESKDLPISHSILKQIRRAHSSISDEEFEVKKAEAVQTETPLTRKVLIDEGTRKRRIETRKQREENLSAKATQLPTGEQKFSVIYADPPYGAQYGSGYGNLSAVD